MEKAQHKNKAELLLEPGKYPSIRNSEMADSDKNEAPNEASNEIRIKQVYTKNGVVADAFTASMYGGYEPAWLIESKDPTALQALLEKMLDKCVGEYGFTDEEYEIINNLLQQVKR